MVQYLRAPLLELRLGEVRRINLPRTPVNRGMKRGREDRPRNVHGYRTGAMDCLGASLVGVLEAATPGLFQREQDRGPRAAVGTV